jgi:hypothetical protein
MPQYAEDTTGTFGSGAKIPSPTTVKAFGGTFNTFGEQPPSDIQIASAIQGAPNDPSVLARKPADQAKAATQLQEIVARGTGKTADYWKQASLPALVSPFASFEAHSAALDKAIAQQMHGANVPADASGELASITPAPAPAPEFGSIASREAERTARFGTPTQQPNFGLSIFKRPAVDPRYASFPRAPKPLTSAVTSSSFPQPPR